MFLQENYLDMFPEDALDGAASAADALSVADSLSGDWTARTLSDSKYLGSIFARSIAFENWEDHQLKHQLHKFRRPKWKDVSWGVVKKRPQVGEAFIGWRHDSQTLCTEILPLVTNCGFDGFCSETQWRLTKELTVWKSAGGHFSVVDYLQEGGDYVGDEDRVESWKKSDCHRKSDSIVQVEKGEDVCIEEYSD